MRRIMGSIGLVAVFGMFLATPVAAAQEKKDLELDKIPKAVMDALKAKFPKPEITKWTKEKEGDKVVYDIEFTQEGRKCGRTSSRRDDPQLRKGDRGGTSRRRHAGRREEVPQGHDEEIMESRK